jgi:hypothetical protein
MATTTNFGWTTPNDTDLVKDGAAAIRTALNGVDSSFVDLKGGTTGQVLVKASNTDLDYSWVAQDDSNAIQNAIVDAKGDLIAASANDTPARLAVGTNGQVLTADSTAGTGLAWATPSSGGMTLLSTTTLSGATTTVTTDFSGYVGAYVSIENVDLSVDDGFFIKPNNATDVYMSLAYQVGGAATLSFENGAEIQSNFGSNLAGTNTTNNMLLQINSPASTSGWKTLNFTSIWESSSAVKSSYNGNGGIATTSAITSLVFVPFTGGTTFSAGTVKVYGVK